MSVPVAMIAAVAENGVIGNGGQIPWRLPTDFAHFRRMTMGKPLVMGRKTFESIGKPLPGRSNIVVTHRGDWHFDGVLVAGSLSEALDRAQQIAAADAASEVMIGGGAEVYREAMAVADRLYITHVELAPEGDTRFPDIDPAIWKVETQFDIARGDKDNADFVAKSYVRRGGSAR